MKLQTIEQALTLDIESLTLKPNCSMPKMSKALITETVARMNRRKERSIGTPSSRELNNLRDLNTLNSVLESSFQ